MDGPSDWDGILPEMDKSDVVSVLVPESCCGEFEDNKCGEYFLSGCLDRMHFIIGQSGRENICYLRKNIAFIA